jgi:hypothetical protein
MQVALAVQAHPGMQVELAVQAQVRLEAELQGQEPQAALSAG